MLWDVAPVRIRLPARERATTAEILDHATALLQRCGTGRGAEVLGHPLAPLGSHANLLAERGKTLKAGMTVITGSLSPPPRSVGATAPMAIGGLGEAHLTVLKACQGAGRARNALKKDGTMMLQGKRAIVLGGSSGIGLATTNQLASAGATVIAASRQPQRAQESVRAGVELQVCDVQDREALRALFAASAPFDILVNAATGGTRAMGPFLQMDLDGYRGSFAKLWGYTNSVRLAAEHMDERGTMVLVSGTPARRAKPGQVSLASVGGAVEAFCRAVAPELAPRRINVVSPGIIDTPMFGNDMHERQQRLAGATANHPIPRPGTADEVASAVLFLITNDFVTGTTIDADGGWLLS